MQKIIYILFMIILLPLFSTMPVKAARVYDSNLVWRSIKTEHFRIHYHQGLEDVAARMSVIAEKVHTRLSAEIKWHPALRTDIVLIDSRDNANGMATPIYFNTVELYISRPMLDSTLNNFDNWLESVFTHEYTHILDLDMAFGMPQAGRYILGRFPIFFPNFFQPTWIIEGDAVYRESKNSKYGRNNSTYVDMIMRTEAGTSGLKSIDKASLRSLREWPMWDVTYLYGGRFIQYLEQKYGDGSFARYLHNNADNIIPFSDNIYPIPYFFNKDAKDVYKLSFFRLWENWQIATYIKYNEQIKKITDSGITKYAAISPVSDDSILPRFSRDGSSIFFVGYSRRKGQSLFRYDTNAGKTEKLSRVNLPNSIAVSGDGDVILSDIEYYRSFSIYYELFQYRKCYTQKSTRLRGIYIDAFHSSDKFVIVTNDRDRYSLIIADPAFKNIEQLISNSPVQLSFPRISPDDSKIVFVIKEPGRDSDLVIFDIKEKTITRLTNDKFNDIQPSWHPDGTKIIFSSDRTGIYNLYEYDLPGKKISRMTNLIGGAFQPDISPRGDRIVFASYEENGHRISTMDYSGKRFSEENAVLEKIDLSQFSPVEKKAHELPESSPYTPLYSGFPAYVLPLISLKEFYPGRYDFGFGFLVTGADVLKQHSYMLELMILPVEGRLAIDASYTLSILYPNLTLGYYDNAIFINGNNFPGKNSDILFKRVLQRTGYFTIEIPVTFIRHQHDISVSYQISQQFTDINFPNSGIMHDESIIAGVQIAYNFTNVQKYTYSISKENGCELFLLGDINHKALGSDDSFYAARAQFNAYIPGFAANNVILLGLRGGIAFDYPSSMLGMFGLGKLSSGNINININNLIASGSDLSGTSWGMRGYGAGSVYGSRIAVGTFEYRLPLIQRDAGIITVPVMFRDLWLKLFYEYGNVWSTGFEISDFKHSAGAEINLNLMLGYMLNVTCYIGYAYGFSQYGEHQVYFGINSVVEWLVAEKNPMQRYIR